MGVKIAHCSDIHIGTKCEKIGYEKSSIISEDIKETFFKLLRICQQEHVDILLIAGDLFEDTGLNKRDIENVISEIKKYSYSVVISPGNHDPVSADSPYLRFDWPENVIIFESGESKSIVLKDKGVALWGEGFGAIYEKSCLMKNIVANDNGLINICVMHGDLSGASESRYNLISRLDIERSKMDYVALGHIHKRTEILRAGDTYYAYSGNLQSAGFNDTGDKGFYIGTLDKGACSLEFKKLCKRVFDIVHVNVCACEFVDDFARTILENLKEKYGESYKENLYQIILEGELPEEILVDVTNIKARVGEQVFYAQIIDNTEPAIDLERLKFRADLKGLFIKKMLKMIETESDEYEAGDVKQALKVGLKAFEGDVKYIDN